MTTFAAITFLFAAPGCEQTAEVGETADVDVAEGPGDDANLADARPSETSNGNGDAGHSEPDASLDDRERALAEMMKTYCETTYECPKTGALDPFMGLESAETCKQLAEHKPRAFTRSGVPDVMALILTARVTLNSEYREACLEGLKRSYCSNEKAYVVSEACLEYLQPAQERGDPCVWNAACKDDLVCDKPEDACEGTCQPADREPSCGETNCADDEYCADRHSDNPSCESLKSVGEQCDTTGSCESGAGCTVEFGSSEPGRCVEYGSQRPGDSCNGDVFCETGLGCNDGTCEPIALVDEGAACGTADEVQTCRPSLRCEPSRTSEDATCRQVAGEGESCGSAVGGCQPGLFCTQNEVCEPLRSIGEECLADRQCASQNCDGGECAEISICPG